MSTDLLTLRTFKGENVFNPWAERDVQDRNPHAHLQRIDRLMDHFRCDPDFLLIGEAPGYAGCRVSGIPFTNEKLLLDGGIPRVTVDGRLTTRPLPWSEPSATIVWGTLYKLGIERHTVLWNAFPWHPHRPGEPYSNRAPTAAELAAGRPVLLAVLERFAGARVVAVGNVAAAALEASGVKGAAKVRHPSRGGGTAFRVGLDALVRKAA